MAELKYIPFYPGYMEDTSDLSDGEFRRLMYALCAYCEGAERPEPLTGKEVIAYRFITRNIKVSQEQYIAKCRKNSENAKKRTIANDSERKRSQANVAYNDMQVDHFKPQRAWNPEDSGTDDIENLMPSCRMCNHYKRAHDLETFRRYIAEIPRKLQENYIYKVGIAYGNVLENPKAIKFYFEKVRDNHATD